MEFQALHPKNAAPSRRLETFDKPGQVSSVTFASDELTSLCPITEQPDFSRVEIEYHPDRLCIESKSLKLYLWSFRDEAAFCEALADRIARDVYETTRALYCRVTLTQSVRGGISTRAVAEYRRD